MGEASMHDRRERYAGLLEMVRDRCHARGLVFVDEMAALCGVWLAVDATRGVEDRDPIADSIVRGPIPFDFGLAEKARPPSENRGQRRRWNPPESAGAERATRTEPRPVAIVQAPDDLHPHRHRHYREGYAAGRAGLRCNPPYSGRGGYGTAWRRGWEDARTGTDSI